MTEFTVDLTHGEAVATITLRGPKGNSVDFAGLGLLADRLAEAAADRPRLLVLRGADGEFCHGRSRGAGEADLPDPWSIRRERLAPITDVYASVYDFPVPVIAAVEGQARGFGCALVAACDVAIAADDAQFALPEMLVDSPPLLAMSSIAYKVRPAALMPMVLSGTPIDARHAASVGLVSEVVRADDFETHLSERVGGWAVRSTAALQAVKAYARNLRAQSALSPELATSMLALAKDSITRYDA